MISFKKSFKKRPGIGQWKMDLSGLCNQRIVSKPGYEEWGRTLKWKGGRGAVEQDRGLMPSALTRISNTSQFSLLTETCKYISTHFMIK